MLDRLLLVNKGTEVVVTADLGRVLVATRDFDTLYEPILREKPSLVFEGDQQFLEEFNRADDSIKEMVLALYHPELDSKHPTMVELWSKAWELAPKFLSMDPDLILKLLAIKAMNSHSYQGSIGKGTMCLSPYAAMVEHSCEPNVSYASKTADGALEYKVIRPIRKGDHITFSYVPDVFEKSTKQRREVLLKNKLFLCKCSRCLSADFCRSAKCPSCNKLHPCHQEANETNCWHCPDCGPQPDVSKMEESLLEQLKPFVTIPFSFDMNRLSKIMDETNCKLSTTHCIAICARKRYLKFLRGRDATEEGLRIVSLIECAAHGCTGCAQQHGGETKVAGSSSGSAREPTFQHDPVYSCAFDVFQACKVLMNLPSSQRSTYALAMVRRYIPVMRGNWGQAEHVTVVQQTLLPSNCTLCCKVLVSKNVCSRCKKTQYCGKDCQVKHWSVHKKECVVASTPTTIRKTSTTNKGKIVAAS